MRDSPAVLVGCRLLENVVQHLSDLCAGGRILRGERDGAAAPDAFD